MRKKAFLKRPSKSNVILSLVEGYRRPTVRLSLFRHAQYDNQYDFEIASFLLECIFVTFAVLQKPNDR